MTRTTIARNLKKKLSASLENLTPRQAGRLFLILFHEAQDKGIFPPDYPPLQDLEAAWERRLDQAKQSKAGEAFIQEVKLYKGWLFLRSLVVLANMSGSSDVWLLLGKAQSAYALIDRLLLLASFSEVARLVDDRLTYETPKPASHDEYARLTAWAEEDALVYLETVADYLAEDGPYGADDMAADRRQETAKRSELEDHLVALWQAGKLDACLAVTLRDSPEYPVALDAAGTIPAWAALRAVWADWLHDQGYYQSQRATPHPQALDGVRAVINLADGEDVEGEDLARLAGDFLADCKKRPWGRNLPAPQSVDLAALGFFLTTVETPLTPDTAPDLGRVVWEVFAKSEKDAVVGDPAPAASMRSLKSVVAALGSEFSYLRIRDRFFPTDDVVTNRRNLARIVRLVRSMQVAHQTFTYPPRMKDDMTLLVGDLADFFGVSFLTPLQEAIRFLGGVFGEVATFRRTYELLSDEYFGGLPLLDKETRDKLDLVDTVLAAAEEQLADWLARLARWPWKIDTTSLQLIKADVDEDEARWQADDIVAGILTSLGLRRQSYDLGPEDPPPAKRP